MNKPFRKLDEREKNTLYKIAAIMYFITIYALIAVLLYRDYILGQPASEFNDIALIVTFNVLGFLSALLYLGGISFKGLNLRAILGLYIVLVIVGTVFNIIMKPLESLGAVLDDLKIILPVSAAIIGLYVLFAYIGKRKMDKQMT